MSNYALARCELYTEKRHGFVNNEINNCIICMETICAPEMIEFIQRHLWKDTVYYILSNICYTKLMDIKKIIGSITNNKTKLEILLRYEY